MKNLKLMGALATGMLLFGACNSDNDAISQDLDQVAADGSQKLIINLSSGGDRATRSGRPLFSSEAKQDVNRIVLYVVNRGGSAVDDPSKSGSETIEPNRVVLCKTIDANEWNNAIDHGTNGKQLEISFKGSDGQKLAEGTYDIYAMAYKEESATPGDYSTSKSNYDFTTIDVASEWKTGENLDKEFFTKLKVDAEAVSEIFAGKIAVKVVAGTDANSKAYTYFVKSGNSDSDKKPTAPLALVLNRQVAGVTGYFTNIPKEVGGVVPTKLRLVSSSMSNKIWFTNLVSGETATKPNEAGNDNSPKNVINGENASTAAVQVPFKNGKKGYVVYTIDLKNFAKDNKAWNELDFDGDGYVGYSDFTGSQDSHVAEWVNPNKSKGQNLKVGSVFGSNFVIPFALVEKQNTMELQLLGDATVDGKTKTDAILKTWNVAIAKDQLVGASAGSFAPGLTSTGKTQDASALIYNVYRNHMYSLGIKKTDDGPDGPTPDPEDKPEDLSTGENLMLHVNDNWEIIHQMEID